MKHAGILLLPIIASLTSIGVAHAGSISGREAVPVTQVFTPKGFDTNDDTQVIVSGYLPNLCYKAQRVSTKVSGQNIFVTVKAFVEKKDVLCPQLAIPFLEPVSVGVMGKGTYNVVVNAGTPLEKRAGLGVSDSTTSLIDENVYANVDYVERVPGTRRVILKGYNPSDCYEFDRVEFISNGKDTYSVLPIMRKLSDFCPRKLVALDIPAEVPRELKAEELLLHVRVMNGKSINALFDNRENP